MMCHTACTLPGYALESYDTSRRTNEGITGYCGMMQKKKAELFSQALSLHRAGPPYQRCEDTNMRPQRLALAAASASRAEPQRSAECRYTTL
jgi:hypothetical protein